MLGTGEITKCLSKPSGKCTKCRAWMVILNKGRGTDESLEEKFRLITISRVRGTWIWISALRSAHRTTNTTFLNSLNHSGQSAKYKGHPLL